MPRYNMILGLDVLYKPLSLLCNREITYHILSYGFVVTVKISFFRTFLFFTGETRRMNLCQAINNALHTTLANDPTSSK
jgi:hypothetical protein